MMIHKALLASPIPRPGSSLQLTAANSSQFISDKEELVSTAQQKVTNIFDPTSKSLYTMTTARPAPVECSGGGIYISEVKWCEVK